MSGHDLPSSTCFWINIQINQSDVRDKFTVYIKFRLYNQVWVLFPSDFRDKLWVGLGLELELNFKTGMLFQG